MFPGGYSANESPYKDVHVSFKGMENIFLLKNVQSTMYCNCCNFGRLH